MTGNHKRVLAVVVMAALVAANAFGETGCGFQGKGDKAGKWKENITRELNLTQDQEKRLEGEKKAHREEMLKLRDAMKEKNRALRDALAKPGATREQVEPIAAGIKNLQSTMMDKRLDGIFAVKEILTPEQFAKLQTLKEEKMKSGKKKHGGKER